MNIIFNKTNSLVSHGKMDIAVFSTDYCIYALSHCQLIFSQGWGLLSAASLVPWLYSSSARIIYIRIL